MIKYSHLFTLIFIGLISLSFSKKNEIYSLTVTVNSLRNSDGVVLFLLYNEDGTIPDKDRSKYYKKFSSSIASNKATITFDSLPQGKYAINIIHDENSNGKIDMGFLLPKEGIGFSNFKKLNIFNRPNFSKASFKLDTDISINIKTIYM
ncbi:MAG TPA: DUF2141 domain-containing protein [Lutibacter sp.]|nr:DUF2141 domain-containing protein [Lutibacter sp.]